MRRISPATVTFGVMAIVLGLVSAYIVRQALHKPPVVAKVAPPPPVIDDSVPVVYALVNIPKHSRLRMADLAVGKVPKDSPLVKGTYRFSSAAEGRIATDAIRAGQAIRAENLLGIGEGLPDLADRLPEGHRAVTIALEGADTGGKRLQEGDTIDIAMTVEGTHPDLGEVTTRTLMHNVLVVDAGAGEPVSRSTGSRPALGGRNNAAGSIITVAVLPADANKLIVAQRTGTLHATLVSNSDAAGVATDDAISRRALLGLKEIVPPKRFTVEKWTGTSMQVIEMSDDRVQESRDVTGGSPVATPAPGPQAAPSAQPVAVPPHSVQNLPSGVKEPAATVVAAEPFALAEQAEAN